MNSMTVHERLVMYAKDGHTSSNLNLYKRQIEQLVIKDGIAVQCGASVPGWKGQYHCRVGWRYALPGTTAWHLLELAVENNPKLREEIQNSSEESPLFPPYSSDAWKF